MRRLVTVLLAIAAAGAAHAQPAAPSPQEARQQALAENALITEVNAATDPAAKKALLLKLIALNPRLRYQVSLGGLDMAAGDHAGALADYDAAIARWNGSHAAPDPDAADGAAQAELAYSGRASALVKLKRMPEALAAYAKTTEVAPLSATAWFNVCAMAYNQGEVKQSLAACDRAIALNPGRADAYFIKGSLMVGDATVGKDGKPHAPPGALESLHKYLDLAPAGPHAADVREMLAYFEKP